MNTKSIPVIDITHLNGSTTLTELDHACRTWGFFQITNHGIRDDVIAELHRAMRAFFALPIDTKRAISRTQENPWGFYDHELTKNTLDQKQIFDYGPGDGHALRPQWPANLPKFRRTVLDYARDCEKLAYKLLAAISTNLGMAPGYLSRAFGPLHSSFLRLNYYPVSNPAEGFGVHHHTDAGALTLLLQDDQAGLEVYRDGEWSLVEPRRDALVVNVGDIVQVWSNDRYRAALHRVIASARQPRYSAPYFFCPNYRATYAPVPTEVDDLRPARYRPIRWGEFYKLRTAGDYADLGEEIQVEHYRI
jgi:isopenicillin N synthase-like dioxygenase